LWHRLFTDPIAKRFAPLIEKFAKIIGDRDLWQLANFQIHNFWSQPQLSISPNLAY
jgi:hypothetical protein